MSNSTREVIITGGRGYIGMNLTHYLVSHGLKVHNLDKVLSSPFGPLPDGAVAHEVDLTEPEANLALQRVFKTVRDTSAVIHLAGLKSVEESFRQESEYRKANVTATENLLESMRAGGLSRLLFASTAAVYGEITNPNPVAESTSTLPISPYAQTKLEAENIIKAAHEVWGLKYASMRFFNVAGSISPELIEYSGKNLIPVILRSISAGNPFKVFGDKFNTPDGSAIRDFVHIEDLCAAQLCALSKLEVATVGEINIGSGKGYSVFEIINTLKSVIGKEIPYTVVPARVGDAPSVVADIHRAQQIIGWKPQKSLAEMLKSSIVEDL